MILNWTSKINQETIETGSLTDSQKSSTYSVGDLMKAHVWKLYCNLTSSGWGPISASVYNTSMQQYQLTDVNNPWAVSSSINFPLSMSKETEEEILLKTIEERKNFAYTPTPHSWVMLSKSFDDGVYFMTIDCRYPLPPHKPNSNLIIERMGGTNSATGITVTPYIASEYSGLNKIFLGASGIYYEKNSPYAVKKDLNNDGIIDVNTVVDGFLNNQDINCFDGICFTGSQTTSDFDMNNVESGQDYISRCVSFIDIVFHRISNNSTDINTFVNNISNPNSDYDSCKTSVRPKNGKDDDNAWYVCWGFDYLEKNDQNFNRILSDKINIDEYKYAFHEAKNSTTNVFEGFIYQIYKNTDNNFRSGFGFLPLKNRPSEDAYGHTSFCVNCDPSKDYSEKSINFNTIGNKINYISGSTSVEYRNNLIGSNNNDSVNSFFNTCFRNYNFSDGISSFKAGNGLQIGLQNENLNLPAFAPTDPSDSTIMSQLYSNIACNKNNTNADKSLETYDFSTISKYISSDPPTKISLGSSDSGFTKNKNTEYKENQKYLYTVKKKNTTKSYSVYTIDGSGVKKVVLDPGCKVPFSTLQVKNNIYSNTGNTHLEASYNTLSSKAIFFQDYNDIIISLQDSLLSSLPSNIKLRDFFEEELFNGDTSDDPKVRVYVGKRSVGVPAAGKNVPLVVNKSSRDGSNLLAFSGTSATPSVALPHLKENLTQNAAFRDIFFDITGKTSISDIMLTDIYKTSATVSFITSGGATELVHCFIDVPLSDLYEIKFISPYGATTILNQGNFNYKSVNSNPVKYSQHRGANFFSVFKTAKANVQNPLAVSIFTFLNSKDSISENCIFGITKEDSMLDNRYLEEKDVWNKYSELPTFVFSCIGNNSNSDSQKGQFKGYIPDITFAPNSIKNGTLVKNDSPATNYKKIFWGGFWFPWVADEGPGF